ncbi:UNVERIFIED_CONTAM: hypothetical protein GTU68_033603 [Idotea baltica]|nr:hypothetical protein [Idotea baltica]
MKILITGGVGFIGSNFILNYLEKYPDIEIVNLDKLTYAANTANLESIKNHKRYIFIKGDICDRGLLQGLFDKHKFKGVIHFAAESHVDKSIKNPTEFINTNILGTFNLIDIAKRFENSRFHHISTDEVYGSLGKEGLFTEQTAYAPNSPYSASKASSDFIVRSYFHTYGMPVITTNCSNNYGPNQHDEKLIPTIIRKALLGENIPIYGDGKNVRDWLYVEDHCSGIDLAFNHGVLGETYNIGGDNERNNLYIANAICNILDEVLPKSKTYKEQIVFVTDRPGHDFRYAIDASKIEEQLGWKAQENFETGIRKTVDWYIKKYKS